VQFNIINRKYELNMNYFENSSEKQLSNFNF